MSSVLIDIHYPGLQDAQCKLQYIHQETEFHSYGVGNAHRRGYPSHHDSMTIYTTTCEHLAPYVRPSGVMSVRITNEGGRTLDTVCNVNRGGYPSRRDLTGHETQTQEVATCTHLAVSRVPHHNTGPNFTSPS